MQAALGKKSFRDYLRWMWDVVEPATPFIDGFHVGAMCEHGQAVIDGQIKKLAINICPRIGKSITMSVGLPTWAWTKMPSLRFLCASYSGDLALDFATMGRTVIESSWYRDRWDVELISGEDNKHFYRNTQRGYRLSVGMLGSAIGRGGDILLFDDPHNLATIASNTIREKDISIYFKVFCNRVNQKTNDRQIITMQRGHEDDLINRLSDEWVILRLPSEYVPRQWTSPIGWSDPRTVEGELMCPERFGPDEIRDIKRELGSVDYSCQHGQDPLPEKGGLFERSWFEIVKRPPTNVIGRTRFWDAAGTEDDGAAFTAGVKMSQDNEGIFYVEDVKRVQKTAAHVKALMKATAHEDGIGVSIVEEQEPGSAGKNVIASNKVFLAGFDYSGRTASGEKQVRWKPLAAQSEPLSKSDIYGNVKIVEGEWNKAFLDELVANVRGRFKDQLDAASGALNTLTIQPDVLRTPPTIWG